MSDARPVDAALAVDALTRAHRDLDRPQTACPRASTGLVVVVGFNKGAHSNTWGKLNDR